MDIYTDFNKGAWLIKPSFMELNISKFLFFYKCNFYTNISILAAVSHDDKRAAPSSIFSDAIDCVKFITISKATKEKMLLFIKFEFVKFVTNKVRQNLNPRLNYSSKASQCGLKLES